MAIKNFGVRRRLVYDIMNGSKIAAKLTIQIYETGTIRFSRKIVRKTLFESLPKRIQQQFFNPPLKWSMSNMGSCQKLIA
jgi:hypothetical protein